MMLVATSTSASPRTNASITSSSSCSAICPWAVSDPQVGQQRAQALGRLLDRLDPVVEVEALAAAGVLAAQGLGHQRLVVLAHVGGDRPPARRRRLDDADVAEPRERDLQRPRDRRGAHRQHVHAQPQLAQRLLLGHAEALLLVDDHQAEVLRLHVHRQQAVGADQDVQAPVAVAPEHLARLGGRAEAVDHVHGHGQVAEALAEGGQVLLGEDRGGRQHQHLLAAGRRLEGRAHGDLGLAEADVAADQAVHRAGALHVVGDGVDRALLVAASRGGGKRRSSSRISSSSGGKAKPVGRGARLVERDQLAGHLPHGGPRARLHAVPGLAAQLGEGRRRAVGADVAGHPVELVVGHVEAVAVGEGQREVVAREARDGAGLEGGQPADAVVLVHDVVADPQVEEAGQAAAHDRAALRRGRRRRRMRSSGITREAELARDEPALAAGRIVIPTEPGAGQLAGGELRRRAARSMRASARDRSPRRANVTSTRSPLRVRRDSSASASEGERVAKRASVGVEGGRRRPRGRRQVERRQRRQGGVDARRGRPARRRPPRPRAARAPRAGPPACSPGASRTTRALAGAGVDRAGRPRAPSAGSAAGQATRRVIGRMVRWVKARRPACSRPRRRTARCAPAGRPSRGRRRGSPRAPTGRRAPPPGARARSPSRPGGPPARRARPRSPSATSSGARGPARRAPARPGRAAPATTTLPGRSRLASARAR